MISVAQIFCIATHLNRSKNAQTEWNCNLIERGGINLSINQTKWILCHVNALNRLLCVYVVTCDFRCLLLTWHPYQISYRPIHHSLAEDIHRLFNWTLNWFATTRYSAQLPSLYRTTATRIISVIGFLTVSSSGDVNPFTSPHKRVNDRRLMPKFSFIPGH